MSKKSLPSVVLVYACKKKWEKLQIVNGTPARWCSSCKQSVFPVEDVEGVKAAIAQNRCIYLKVDEIELVGGAVEVQLLGIPSLDPDEVAPR